MPAEEQSDVPSLTDPSHTSLHDGLERQHSTLHRLERGAEPNVSLRGNRHSLPPDFLLPNIRTTDTSASSTHHARDTGQPLDEATIANRTAALRRLNGAAPRHRRAENTRTRTSLSSQPIVVRTYSGSPTSRPLSDQRVSATMFDRRSTRKEVGLPSAEVFSFENILQAVERGAREDVDAIAEICGRSKMSLANEYDAHMPPQGDLMAVRPDINPSSMVRSSLNQTLTPVNEGGSINERLSDTTQSIHDTTPSTCRQTSFSPGHVPSSLSTSFAPAVTPTKVQQKVLEQSALPVMLLSEAALPAQEASKTTLWGSKPPSQHDDSLVSGKAVFLTEQEVSKESLAQAGHPLSTEGVSDSSRRQSSLVGGFGPWLSWTSKAAVSAENERNSSGLNAASSLRGILARKGTPGRVDG